MSAVPDLLHEVPRLRPEHTLLRQQLVFAIESAGVGALFERALDAAPPTPTQWEQRHFAKDLFLDELVTGCFSFSIDDRKQPLRSAWLKEVLSRPPSDSADRHLRQRVLRELQQSPQLFRAAEELYAELRRLRILLTHGDELVQSGVRRKIEMLAVIRRIVDHLAEGFTSASSALARLCTFAKQLRHTEGFTKLSHVLDYEDHLATLQVRVRLGYDGAVREFAIVQAHDNRKNPLVQSPLRRFFTRMWAFFRGYRVGADELLTRYVDEVFSLLAEPLSVLFHHVSDIEVYLACMGFRRRCAAAGLEVSLPQIDAPGDDSTQPWAVTGLFNPLLLLQGIRPVPADLQCDRPDALVVLTGPNSGGKTRLLQALSLTQMLGQAGFFVPAAHARLIGAPTLFASITDEVDVRQKEGRLGTELARIRRMFEEIQPSSMVVLDELCSGTNPSEGEKIFEMVVKLLPELHPLVFVTTHFLGMADRMQRTPPVDNLRFLKVELDAMHQPTYRFVAGVADTSLAKQVAERLGVTREELDALVARRITHAD